MISKNFLAAAFGAAALLSAGVAMAKPDVHLCSDEQGSDKTDQLRVTYTFEDGVQTDLTASWKPKETVTSSLIAPSVHIYYEGVSAERLGTPSSIMIPLIFPMRGTLMGGTVTLTLPDGRSWSVPIRSAFEDDLQGRPIAIGLVFLASTEKNKDRVNVDLLEAVEGIGEAVLEVKTAEGALVSRTEFNLADHNPRDTMFAKAWPRATKKAEKPNRCEKVKD